MNTQKKFLSLLFAITLVGTQAGIAFARNEPPDPLSIDGIEVQMELKCDELDDAGREYAREHNYCPSKDGDTENIVTSNCGSAWLFMSNQGGGFAQFNIGAVSTMGAIVIANYNVSWVNWSLNPYGNGYVAGTDYLFNTNWSKSRVRYTQPGSVSAVLTGSVTLWWGGLCGFLTPFDNGVIT